MKKIEPTTVSFCIPVVSETLEDLEKDVKSAIELKPDFIEIRRDYFKNDDSEMIEFLKEIHQNGQGIIFTFRSPEEGGNKKADNKERLEAIRKAVDAHCCDYIDIEDSSENSFKTAVISLLSENGIRLILSKHNFEETPDEESIKAYLKTAADQADIVKAAFKANSKEDLEILKNAGHFFRENDPDKPLILIAMGELGTESRLIPEDYYSNLSFATDKKSSAPGQLSLEEVRNYRSAAE